MICRFGTFSYCLAILIASPAVLAAPSTFHSAVLGDNPLLWYQLSEASGNIVNHGSLGSAYNATVFGAPGRLAATIGGDAGMAFDSSDDFLESLGSSTLSGNPTFSIETLIYLPLSGSANFWGPYLHWGDGGGADGNAARNGREVFFGAQSNNLNRTYAGFYNAGLRTQSTVPTDRWIHLVWTRQGGSNSGAGSVLYLNGSPVNLQQDPSLTPGVLTASLINVTGTPFRINRGRDFLGSRFFTGTIDEIALYDRVLTAQEVMAHAQAIPNLSGITGDFDFDGDVDGRDFLIWQRGSSPSPNSSADLAAWQSNFGLAASIAATSIVPEPGALAAILAAGGVARRPRRGRTSGFLNER